MKNTWSVVLAASALLVFTSSFAGDSSPKRKLFQYNFSEFGVGTVENEKGPTGVTVFTFPETSVAAADIRGGAAAVRESSSIDELSTWPMGDAIVLAGGSTYGLEAASGVMSRLLEVRGKKTDFMSIPQVPSAIVYDFRNRKDAAVYPDKELGRRGYDAVKTNQVWIGQAGAGRNVTIGKYFGSRFGEVSGQGAAFIEKNGVKIFALTVLNAVGNILDLKGNIIAGNRDPKTGVRRMIADQLLEKPQTPSVQEKGNTTISIVITNVKMSHADIRRIGVMTHTGMGRVIDPFQTPDDGDTLFSVSTQTIEKPQDISIGDIGTLATRAMQLAVQSAIESSR